jgi:endonuclease/exonuclease/phosphatase family metal-dependent hydrolase
VTTGADRRQGESDTDVTDRGILESMPRRTAFVARLLCVAALAAAVLALVPASAGAGTVSGGRARPGSDDRGLRVVNYNLLHGIFCDDGTACQAPDRVELFLRRLEAAGCPEIVGLQEINDNLRSLFAAKLPAVCAGDYRAVFADADANDGELVLTTRDPAKAAVLTLPGRLRTASRVELDGPGGPVVLVVTHQDGDKPVPACRDDITRYRCPRPCPEGTTFSECQTVMAARLADRGGPRGALRIYMGDFNVPAGSTRHTRLLADGWIDSHLAAGNPECDPASGAQCTAGRADNRIAALKDPTAREQERIDFIFVKAPRSCTPVFDPATDADGDGLGTGLFAADPAVDGPGGLVWPSDHTAVSMDLTCS